MQKKRKSVTLIIAICLMIIFAVAGATLLMIQSTDFQLNVRSLDSERALYLAESGMEWAFNQLAQEFSCLAISGSTFPHTLDLGQYTVNCSCPACPGSEGAPKYCEGCGEVVITSIGYIPTQDNYRATRTVEVKISPGAFAKAVTGLELFDWDGTRNHSIKVTGDLQAPEFEGNDTDTDTNEPEDLDIPGTGQRIIGPTSLPTIDMAYFEEYARDVKGHVFTGDFTFDKSNYNKWGKGVYYVKKDPIGETEGKATIDLAKGDIPFNQIVIVAEGGIEITGTNSISMKSYVDVSRHETFPNLASENGDITSPDEPEGAGDKQKRGNRTFDGLIFTKGDVTFNYINGTAIMGKRVILEGSIELEYEKRYIEMSDGFIMGNVSAMDWQEK